MSTKSLIASIMQGKDAKQSAINSAFDDANEVAAKEEKKGKNEDKK